MATGLLCNAILPVVSFLYFCMFVNIYANKKKKAYKRLKDGTGDQAEYKRWKKESKRAVAKAIAEAWKEWYEELDTKEGGGQDLQDCQSESTK